MLLLCHGSQAKNLPPNVCSRLKPKPSDAFVQKGRARTYIQGYKGSGQLVRTLFKLEHLIKIKKKKHVQRNVYVGACVFLL